MSAHCRNLKADRALGDYWERQFCALAANYGRAFTAHQIGRQKSAQAFYRDGGKYHPLTLPDITIWTRPGEHHEIKHKDATRLNDFGLERYRLDALLWFAEETGQSVYYTIHDHGLQSFETREQRRECRTNTREHWLTCSVVELADNITRTDWGESYVRNEARGDVERCYWHRSLFQPVIWLWSAEYQRDGSGFLIAADEPRMPQFVEGKL